MDIKNKGSREAHRSGSFRKDRSKKKIPPKNRYSAEKLSDENISSSAKRLKTDRETSAPEDPNIEYRILNFLTVFSALSECVKCKKCDSDVRFSIESTRGLGFKIVVSCSSCKPTFIPSCPYIDTAYEINTRFFFVMRLLGIGLRGAMKFCGLMDLPPPLQQTTYDMIINNIHSAASSIVQLVLKQAVKEEQQEIMQQNSNADITKLTVSGDGTWRKRGFASLYGVAVLIGQFTGKVVDFLVKSSYCAECNYWNKHKNAEQYEEWKSNHDENCEVNHEGSSDKMEVDAMTELFSRSVEKHGVMYTNYVGDSDSKTYTGVVNAKPYGDEIKIVRKECVGHVQKRMGTSTNESFKELIWKMAPKTMNNGDKMVNIAALLATCTFNNGVTSLLEIMNVLGMSVGSRAHSYAAQEDETRIAEAEQQAQEGRLWRRQQNLETMNIPSTVENLHSEPDIDDST